MPRLPRPAPYKAPRLVWSNPADPLFIHASAEAATSHDSPYKTVLCGPFKTTKEVDARLNLWKERGGTGRYRAIFGESEAELATVRLALNCVWLTTEIGPDGYEVQAERKK